MPTLVLDNPKEKKPRLVPDNQAFDPVGEEEKRKEAVNLNDEYNIPLHEGMSLIAGPEPSLFGKQLNRIKEYIREKTGLFEPKLAGKQYREEKPIRTAIGMGAYYGSSYISGRTGTALDILAYKTKGDKTFADSLARITEFEPTPEEANRAIMLKYFGIFNPAGAAVRTATGLIPKSQLPSRALKTVLDSGLTFVSTDAALQFSENIIQGKPIDWNQVHMAGGIGVLFGTGEAIVGNAVEKWTAKQIVKEWRSIMPELKEIPDKQLNKTAQALLDTYRVKFGEMDIEQWSIKHSDHLYKFSENLKNLSKKPDVFLLPDGNIAPEAAQTIASKVATKTGIVTPEGSQWLAQIKDKINNGIPLTSPEKAFIKEAGAVATTQLPIKPPEAAVKAERSEGTKPQPEPTSSEIVVQAGEIEGVPEQVDKKGEKILYHGSINKLTKLEEGITYLAPNEQEAKTFGKNVHKIVVPEGKTKDISEGVNIELEEGGEVEDYIEIQADIARNEGYDYLTYTHPSPTGEDFDVTVALYPEKLNIQPATPQTQGEKPAKKIKTVKMPEIASGMMPQEPAGLTKAESEFLGKREKDALRIAQKLGYPVGYKTGYREAALKGKRMLDALRFDNLVSEKSKKDAKELIDFFVPKEERARYTKRLLEVKTAKDVERLSNQIEKFIDYYEHRRAIRDFKKFIKQVNKDYRRGEVKLGKLPAHVREKFEKILNEYDLTKLSEDKAEELNKHKEYIQRIAGSVAEAFRNFENLDEKGIDVLQLPNRRVLDLERLEKEHIGKLTTEQIQYIQDELQSLITNEQRKQEIRNNIRSEFAHTYITKAHSEIYERPKTKKGEVKSSGIGTRLLDIEQANLRTLVKNITTGDAKATEEFLVDRQWDSLREKDSLNKKWELSAEEGFKGLNLGDEFLKQMDKEVEIVWGGEKKLVPNWVLFNTYLDSQADGNLKRLLNAKTHSFINERKNTVYLKKLTLGELQEITKNIPDKWKQAANFMFRHNRQNNAPAINKTSMLERGYPIAIFNNYWSFPRRVVNIPAGQKTEIALAAENRGRYQKRTGGNEEHLITNPLIQFYSNMQQDADYAAMTLARQDAKALLGDRTWRKKIEHTGNKAYVDAIIKMLQRAEGMASDTDIADYLAGKYLSTFGKGTLSLRPSGAFIQAASLDAAYPVIESKYFSDLHVPTPKEAQALMDKYPTMWKRWTHRNFDFVIGVSSLDDRIRQMVTGKKSKKDAMLSHYTWGDQWAVLKIFDAAKTKIARETNLIEGSAKYEQELEKLFFRAMESQPQWDTLHRSIFTSETGTFKRSFSLFMSARIQQWNVWLQAIDDYEKGRISRREKYMAIGDVITANLKVSLYRHLFRNLVTLGVGTIAVLLGLRDEDEVKEAIKDDLEKDIKKLPQEWVFNLIGLPVYGQIVSTVADQSFRGLTGKIDRTQIGDVRTGSVITDFLVDFGVMGWDAGQFSRDLAKAAMNDEDAYYKSGSKKGESRWKTSGVNLINDTAEIISQLTGYGWSGPRSDIVWPAETALKEEEPKSTIGTRKIYK